MHLINISTKDKYFVSNLKSNLLIMEESVTPQAYTLGRTDNWRPLLYLKRTPLAWPVQSLEDKT